MFLNKTRNQISIAQKFAKLNHYSSLNKTESNVINLSYDLSDKFSSNKALVISHGLFASKASWRGIARRLNEITKQKVRFPIASLYL